MASANEDTGYYLTCRKCKNDGDVGVCTDGIWFFDSKVLENAGPVGSLYCCSKCIVWFRRNSRNWFQDDLQRSWLRYTKKDVCTWPCNSWRSSIQRTDEFVLHFSRLEKQKKTSKSTKKKTVSANTTKTRKKRKRGDVDLVASANCNVMERYNPASTFSSFKHAAKMIHTFLNMCHNMDSDVPNNISDSVYNMLTTQVNVIEGLMQTLEQHMK